MFLVRERGTQKILFGRSYGNIEAALQDIQDLTPSVVGSLEILQIGVYDVVSASAAMGAWLAASSQEKKPSLEELWPEVARNINERRHAAIWNDIEEAYDENNTES